MSTPRAEEAPLVAYPGARRPENRHQLARGRDRPPGVAAGPLDAALAGSGGSLTLLN